MSTPQNEFDRAQFILTKYYRELVKRMAEGIIEHREDFFGSQAGEITESDKRGIFEFQAGARGAESIL
jgi:hypothetical protein